MQTVEVNDSWHIALFVVGGSIKKLFSIDYVNVYFYSIFFSIDFSIGCVNIYFFSLFFSLDFARWKSVGLPHNACIVIH